MIKERAEGQDNPSTWTVQCDDCEDELEPRSSELIAYLIAAAAGWGIGVEIQKFSGVAHHDLCPTCKGRRE